MPAGDPTTTSEPCYEPGPDRLASWPEPHAGAWIGLLETHKRLTRELDSALEVLSRLAAADRQLVRRAQATHFNSVKRLFFDQLTEQEIAPLAEIFARIAPRSSGECAGPAA